MRSRRSGTFNRMQREYYRKLRSNIEFLGEATRVIAIASYGPGDGRTTISFNLAAMFAESGKKSILVNGDMRKSMPLKWVRENGTKDGLSDYLSGHKKLNEVICPSEFQNMSIIYSGSYCHNCAELLGNYRFTELLEELKEIYDYVLIDTPSLNYVIDGSVIAGKCDGTILVIPSDKYNKEEILSVKEQLDAADCNILGVVLNHFSIRKYGGKKERAYNKYFR